MENLATLLKKYQVEIPVIQRDYVQGRDDNKAKGIREKFVEDLLKTVKGDDGKIQHLDFIYGRITDDLNTEGHKKNAESVDQLLSILKKYHTSLDISLTGELPTVNMSTINALKKKMLPLDGQQRLTTLWLFHFVIAHQKNDMPDWMRNFTYKTRKSSRDFCNKLLDEQDKLIICNSYSEIIENQHWFFYKWKNDPTIKGMLVMLDEIFSQIRIDNDWYNNLFTYWENLVGKNKVAFSFLSLNEKNIDDEIYIKMNARGKQLADFEIFKNHLLEYLESDTNGTFFTSEDIKKYAHKLDTNWLDIFWNLKNSNIYDVQDAYYNFLKIFLLYSYISLENKDFIDKEIIKLFLKNNDEKSKYTDIGFSELLEKKVITLRGVKETFRILNLFEEPLAIDTYAAWLKEENYLFDLTIFNENSVEKVHLLNSHFISLSQGLSYYDRTFMMAILYYIDINKLSLENGKENFKRYARVCYNLIYNQNYIQNPETFIQALKSVRKLASLGYDIYKNLPLVDLKSIRFKDESLIEEVSKIQLISKHSSFEMEFIEAEKHSYFRGQIGFIIEYSGGVDNFDIKIFKQYKEKLMWIFSDERRFSSFKLFDRALFAKTNYFIDKGHKRWMFCDPNSGLRNKEEGWRIVFKKNSADIKGVLDKISIENIEKDLNSIIQDYDKDTWRKYFIKSSEIWSFCNKRVLKKTDENYKVRLLKNENAGGTQRELRSKFFELKYKKLDKSAYLPFTSLDYHDAKKQDEEPYAFLDHWNFGGKNYFLDIRYIYRKYELNFSYRNEYELKEPFDDDIVDFLISLNYSQSSKYDYSSYILNIEGDVSFYKHFETILQFFNNLKKTSL